MPLQRLFVEFAVTTGAVFASAEVQRGLDCSGASVSYGSSAERTVYLGRWAGPLPHPEWWSWFGADYVPLVIDHLLAEQVVHAGEWCVPRPE